MSMIIPEIDEIVNFYNAETVEQIARDTGFIQRESKFGGIEFLGIMTAGLFAEPDAKTVMITPIHANNIPRTIPMIIAVFEKAISNNPSIGLTVFFID